MIHVSSQYDTDLKHVKGLMKKMILLVTQQFERSVHAFLECDIDLSKKISDIDNDVNQLELEIDNSCVQLILKRQPTAIDLRFIIACSKVVVDLERIGDESKKIARTLQFGELGFSPAMDTHLEALRKIYKVAKKELDDASEAFFMVDKSVAKDISKRDQKLDSLYIELKHSLVESMKNDSSNIDSILDIMTAVRSMERIGDHAKNISQHVFFISEGEDIRHAPA